MEGAGNSELGVDTGRHSWGGYRYCHDVGLHSRAV